MMARTERLVRELESCLRGPVLAHGDSRYEQGRRGHNQLFDNRPAAIACCVDRYDVGVALALSRRERLPVAVRGGGHSVAGFSSVDDGLVIDLSGLRAVQVDPGRRIARVGGGATAGMLDAATSAFRLAAPAATISTVGVAGFTLAGGIGYLARSQGLAIDRLTGADVVLADGSFVQTDAEHEPELFWAIRGGGGNFGVITELRFALGTVGNVVGGPMLWDLEDAERILDLYLRWLPEQPRDVYAFLAVMSMPPALPLPPEIRGRKVCALFWCNTAPGPECEAAIRVFRRERPLVDAVGELPYAALQRAFDPIAALPARGVIAGQCYERLPTEAARELVRFGEAAPTWQSFTHLYPVDGAAAEPSPDAAAWPWRDARLVQMFLGMSSDAAQDGEVRSWTRGFSAALEPYGMGGTYSNFLMAEDAAGLDRAYGRHRHRLAAAKRCYDPDNVFRLNVNVPPAA